MHGQLLMASQANMNKFSRFQDHGEGVQNDPEIAQSSAAGKTMLQKFVDTRVRKKKQKYLFTK